MIDYANKDWINADRPAYNTHDAEFPRKWAIAVGWMQERRIWRGQADCVHVYRNAEQTKQEGLR